MRDKCNKCLYSCPVNVGEECEMMRACVYILVRGERRETWAALIASLNNR